MPEPDRVRRRRTFTMEDESYERLTIMARAANTNRSRFLEHLILMAEQVLSWYHPEPKRPWWKFWQRRDPGPPALTVIGSPPVQARPRLEPEPRYAQSEASIVTSHAQDMNVQTAATSAGEVLDERGMHSVTPVPAASEGTDEHGMHSG